jgi:hypothetical protein
MDGPRLSSAPAVFAFSFTFFSVVLHVAFCMTSPPFSTAEASVPLVMLSGGLRVSHVRLLNTSSSTFTGSEPQGMLCRG